MKQSRSLDDKEYMWLDDVIHSIDQTIHFIQSDSDFKLYDDRYKINGNDKHSHFKHGNPNVFHGKFRLRDSGGGVLWWEAAPLSCFVCRRATDQR